MGSLRSKKGRKEEDAFGKKGERERGLKGGFARGGEGSQQTKKGFFIVIFF